MKLSLLPRLLVLALALAAPARAQLLYERFNADGTQQLRQINGDGTGDTVINMPFTVMAFPTWSHDGVQFAVSAQDLAADPNRRSYNVFTVTPATGAVRQITTFVDLAPDQNGTREYSYPFFKAFSPDRSALAVSTYKAYGGGAGENTTTPVLEVYAVNGTPVPIQVHVHIGRNGRHHAGEGVDWSPTQNVLVTPVESNVPMPSTPGGNGEVTCLVLTDPVPGAILQGRARQLTFPRADGAVTLNDAFMYGEHDYQPVFSPNGAGVAFVRSFQNFRPFASAGPDPVVQSIHIVNVATGADSVVTTLPAGVYVSSLSWSPDGTALTFDAGQQENGFLGFQQNAVPGTDEVYIVSVDGTGLRRLLTGGAGTPSWRPFVTGGGGGGGGGTPVVSLGADTGSVSRGAGQSATVTLSRPQGSDLSQTLKVKFKLSGRLANGVDFSAPNGTKKIKAGKTSASFKVTPLPGGANGKVTIKLLPGDGYTIDGNPKLKVGITD